MGNFSSILDARIKKREDR